MQQAEQAEHREHGEGDDHDPRARPPGSPRTENRGTAAIPRDVRVDCDLRGDDERACVVEQCELLQARHEHGGRTARQHDGVDSRMSHVREMRGHPAGGDGQPRRDERGERAPCRIRGSRAGRRSGTCMPADSISIAKPMSARKAVVGSAGSNTANPKRAEHEPREQLPDDHGNEHAPARPEQRARKTGEHDHREDAEAHLAHKCRASSGERHVEKGEDVRAATSGSSFPAAAQPRRRGLRRDRTPPGNGGRADP